MKIPFSEISRASADKIRDLLGSSSIWGGNYDDQIFKSNGKYADETLRITRNVSIVPGTLAPAACEVGVDMGDYVNPNADSTTRQLLCEEVEKREEYNKLIDAEIKDLIEKRCASEIAYRCLKAAKEYQDWTPPTFNRTWVMVMKTDLEWMEREEISNAVYFASIELRQDKYKTKPWVVEYAVWMREVRPTKAPRKMQLIASRTVCYETEEKARNYINGRKTWMNKQFFAEDYPPIHKEHAYGFMWAGKMLPGYREEDSK